jgi:hypothetical protein
LPKLKSKLCEERLGTPVQCHRVHRINDHYKGQEGKSVRLAIFTLICAFPNDKNRVMILSGGAKMNENDEKL